MLNKQLENKAYIAGEYSIADMASYPWIKPYEQQGQDLNKFPALKSWFERMATRPAVMKAYDIAKTVNAAPAVTEDGKNILFGQKAR